MRNLTRKCKTTKDKLRTTGYGKQRDVENDNEAEGELELVANLYQDMDEILFNREAINLPRHNKGDFCLIGLSNLEFHWLIH